MALETATGTRPPRGPDGPRATPSHRSGREAPAGRGAEFWWWVFMRVSGIVLVFLVIGHVLIMHVFGGGIDRVNFQFVAVRWQSPFWRTWDWLVLVLALIHGINGLRVIALDYIRPAGVRIAVSWSFYIIGAVLVALGSIIVFTFNPCRWPGIHC
jgi:succinate dehydrogenase / fumarate reductase membrane anchor subunit